MKIVILIGVSMCLYIPHYKTEHKATKPPVSRSYMLSTRLSITDTIPIRITSYEELGIKQPKPLKNGNCMPYWWDNVDSINNYN